jgi:competence protein ComEC
MESIPLFLTKKEFFGTLLVLLTLFCLSLGYEYTKYKQIIEYPTYTAVAKVLSQTHKLSKKQKPYTSYKLQSDDFTFYTISWKPYDIQVGSIVEVGLLTKGIDFQRYLKGFFVPNTFMVKIEEPKIDTVRLHVKNQHQDKNMQELFMALFFAENYAKELRLDISKWGIAHLVAISGFHLGMLSAILYFLLRPLYQYFQDKFFPYRNSYADLALLVFLLLGWYVVYIGAVPSVLRAYVMSIFGYILFAKNIKILSFTTLFFTVALVLILFPKLLFSVAFWFSASGVFYIFLFLHYFSALSKTSLFVLINFWVYILMLPIVHYVFDIFTYYQLFSPFISMAFALFYPVVLFLHVINFGGILDNFITQFLAVDMQVFSLHVSLNFLLFYLGVSLIAIRLRYVAFLLPLVALSIFLVEYIA